MNRTRLLWLGLLIAVALVVIVAIGAKIDHEISKADNIIAEESLPATPDAENGESSQEDTDNLVDPSDAEVLKTDDKVDKETETETEDPFDDYVSPIDFESLRAQNPDVIAWLSIPGTDIDYPVLQHREDDTFYLDHGFDGQKDKNGALFTEAKYNSPSFTDPVTVIYGHNMASGKMFGLLQETFSVSLTEHQEAILYLPDREIHYQLFAALPIGAGHLLHDKNMKDAGTYAHFATKLLNSSSFDAEVIKDTRIGLGERLLILSTCIGHQPDKRYIVAGKEIGNTDNYEEEEIISLEKINLGILFKELGIVEETEASEDEIEEAYDKDSYVAKRVIQNTDAADNEVNTRTEAVDSFKWEPGTDESELGSSDVKSPKTRWCR